MSKRTKRETSTMFDNDRWLTENFEKLVNKYSGEYIIMADGQIYHGGTVSQLRNLAQAEHPKSTIMGLRIPRPEDFLCVLM